MLLQSLISSFIFLMLFVLGSSKGIRNLFSTRFLTTNNKVTCRNSTLESLKESSNSSLISIPLNLQPNDHLNSENYDYSAQAAHIVNCSIQEMTKDGWTLVESNRFVSLFKRKKCLTSDINANITSNSVSSIAEYVMTGTVSDVSVSSFILAQIDEDYRRKWDSYLKEMRSFGNSLSGFYNDYCSKSNRTDAGESRAKDIECNCSDILYYRLKWPWPMKDRDYVLSRKLHYLPQEDAVVFSSKSIETETCPKIPDVVRIDKYVSHSTYFAISSLNSPQKNQSAAQELDSFTSKLYRPGFKFVTFFSDNQHETISPRVFDIMSRQGEKLAVEGMEKLYEVAKRYQ